MAQRLKYLKVLHDINVAVTLNVLLFFKNDQQFDVWSDFACLINCQ